MSNTAPTLSGIFTVDVSAKTEFNFVLNTQDKEGDELSISIDNQPQWLSYTIENDQVKLTATPGFLDIANHVYEISVSDGDKSTSYDLAVNILDNPQKWEDLEVSPSEFLGAWEGANQEFGIVFNDNDQGVLIDSNELSRFEYDAQSLKRIDLFTYGCIYNCYSQSVTSVQVIAKSSNKLYVAYKDSSGDVKPIMLNKVQPHSSDKLFATPSDYSSYSALSYLNSSQTRDSSIEARAHMPSNYTSYDGSNMHYTTFTLQGTYDSDTGRFNAHKKSFDRDYRISYPDEAVDFTVTYDSVEVIGEVQGHLVIKTKYHYKPTNSDVVITEQISDFMAIKSDLIAYPIVPVSDVNPELAIGSTYTGRLVSTYDEIKVGGYDYSGGVEFTITGETTGIAKLETAGKSNSTTLPFTYVKNGSELTVEFNGKSNKFNFYSYPNGQVIMSLQTVNKDSGKIVNTTGYYHYEVDQNISAEDYYGTFEHMNYAWEYYDRMYLSADKTLFRMSSDLLIPEESDYFKVEADGSFSILSSRKCKNAELVDFAACQTYLSDIGYSHLVRNLKILKKENDIYTFKYTSMYTSETEKEMYEGTRRFKKLN
ncbi:hypothetical protein PA25_25520 [Pseudoalteromonas sp. A25]|nr:hypothetical protein PA25_25520 [Pseudoalteromonas sp. A25]